MCLAYALCGYNFIYYKKKYDKLVEEILRRMEENNLYIKLEKYRWKVREMKFLELMIGLEEIKIKKKKVKVVLD